MNEILEVLKAELRDRWLSHSLSESESMEAAAEWQVIDLLESLIRRLAEVSR